MTVQRILNAQPKRTATHIAPDDRAAGIMALMVSRHVRHLPVVTDGKLVGMVSIHDLLQLRLEEVRSEAEAMQKYITGST